MRIRRPIRENVKGHVEVHTRAIGRFYGRARRNPTFAERIDERFFPMAAKRRSYTGIQSCARAALMSYGNEGFYVHLYSDPLDLDLSGARADTEAGDITNERL